MRLIYLLLLCTPLLACSVNPYYDESKAHHTQQGFKNLYYDDNEKGFWAYMRWKWEQLFIDIPQADAYDFPIDRSRHHLLADNTQKTSLTWVGHATFLLQFRGLNILTDPQFSHRASPFEQYGPERVVEPALALDDMPDIDVVVISHDHYDSLDIASVRSLARHNQQRPLTFIVPLGLKPWLQELELQATGQDEYDPSVATTHKPVSIRIVELDWHQSHEINGVRFTAEPVQHWGKRSLFDALERLWASWVIHDERTRIYFAGDTGYAPHFKHIGSQYDGFDLAMIPIGAYAPRWFMKPYHVNPQEAVMMHQDLRSRYSVAMHWGTFILTDEPLDEPPKVLQSILNSQPEPVSPFVVFKHGETAFYEF